MSQLSIETKIFFIRGNWHLYVCSGYKFPTILSWRCTYLLVYFKFLSKYAWINKVVFGCTTLLFVCKNSNMEQYEMHTTQARKEKLANIYLLWKKIIWQKNRVEVGMEERRNKIPKKEIKNNNFWRNIKLIIKRKKVK